MEDDLRVVQGTLAFREFAFEAAAGAKPSAAIKAEAAGKPVKATIAVNGKTVKATFAAPVSLKAGESLTLSY